MQKGVYLHDHLQKMHTGKGTWEPSTIGTYIYHCLYNTYALIQNRLQVSIIVTNW